MSVFEPNWKNIREAVDTIRRGYIVAYPTETFYGLGVNPYDEETVDMLYKLKGWKEKRPISLLIDHVDKLSPLVKEIPSFAKTLIRTFWPGPLTLVFKVHPALSSLLSGGTEKIGIRISSNEIAQQLLEGLNGPLTTTSANPTGEKAATTAGEVEAFFGQKVTMILQGGAVKGVKGSTVIDVTEGMIKVLREGDLPVEEIISLMGTNKIETLQDIHY
jgi:L-threonylcarbamoyladenylate synthase